MTKDMTQGQPLRLILLFAVPMMLGSLFQQFYNLADTIIVGRFVGVDALAAVGSVGGLSYLVLGFVNGIACGFAIPLASPTPPRISLIWPTCTSAPSSQASPSPCCTM